MAKGASFSPASFQLEAWRQLKMRAGSTSSAWVPGHPCLSRQVCAIRVLPEKQNQQETEIKSHDEELACTGSRLGHPKPAGGPAGRAGWASQTWREAAAQSAVASSGQPGAAFQRMRSVLPRLPRIVFLTWTDDRLQSQTQNPYTAPGWMTGGGSLTEGTHKTDHEHIHLSDGLPCYPQAQGPYAKPAQQSRNSLTHPHSLEGQVPQINP